MQTKRKHHNIRLDIYEIDGKLYGLTDEFYSKHLFTYSRDKRSQNIIKDIENKFGVAFENQDNVVCKCGCSKNFSACYGNNSLTLTCNKCGNEIDQELD